MKNALKISGTINLIISLLAYRFTGEIIYPLLLITFSVIYFSYSGKTITYLYNKRTLITIMSIINLFINPISGIITLIGRDKLIKEYEENKEETEELSKEDKKIAMTLNLGIALISISGIILSTTNWNLMSNILKLSILISIAAIFLLLSTLCEKKLKIEILSKNYWLISMLFIILTVIANGYLQVMSNWFSFYGPGKYLYLAMTSIIISLLSIITNNKYEKQIYKNISYIGIVASICSILLHFNVEKEIVLIIINIGLIILNIIKNEKLSNIKELSKYTTIVLSILNIISLLDTELIIYQAIISILTVINITTVTIKATAIEGVLALLIINSSIIITLIKIPAISNITNETTNIIGIIVYSLMYLFNIIKIENINKTFKVLMNIMSNIVMISLLIINTDNKILLTIISAFIVLTSTINYFKNTIKSEKILLPIKIIIFILSLISLLQEVINIDFIYLLIILYLIAFIIYKTTSKEKIKSISIIMYYILFGLSLLINDNQELIPSIINLIAASSVFILINEEQNNKKTKIAYIALLLTITSIFSYTNILNTTMLNNGIIILLIYALLTVLTKENKNLSKINYLSIILPLSVMANDNECTYEITTIIQNIIGLYIIMLIDIFFLKKDKDRNILTTILTTILMLEIIGINSWIIGLYIGIISLILIIIGLIKKEYKGLFIEGIIITIINVLYQFRYILEDLPLWIYTLLAGLILIGIVTYKLAKDKK